MDEGQRLSAQAGRFTLTIDRERQALPDNEQAGLPDSASGVAGIYACLRDDINNNTSTAPDFTDALALARLLQAVELASASGQRQGAGDWPKPL